MTNQITTSTPRDRFNAAVERFNPNSVATAVQYEELRRSLSELPSGDKAILRRNVGRIMDADIAVADNQKAVPANQDVIADPVALSKEIKLETVPVTQPFVDKPVLPDVEKVGVKINLKPLQDDINAYKEFSDDVATRNATAGDGATKRTVETDRAKLDEQRKNIIVDFRKLVADGATDDVLKPILADLRSDKLDISELDEALNDVHGHDKLMRSLEGTVFARKKEKNAEDMPEVSVKPTMKTPESVVDGNVNPTFSAVALEAVSDEPVEAAQSVETGPDAAAKNIEQATVATVPVEVGPDQTQYRTESDKPPVLESKAPETIQNVSEINKNPLDKWFDSFNKKQGYTAESFSKAMPGSEPNDQPDQK